MVNQGVTYINKKQRFYRTCFLNGNDFDKAFYKSYANKLTRVKALAKKLYLGTAITEKKDNPKELWNLIKNVVNTKTSSNLKHSPSKIIIHHDIIENPVEISDHFNNFFVNIGHSLLNNSDILDFEFESFTTYLSNSVSQTIVLSHPLPLEIYNIIKTLDHNKASGVDDISSFFLILGAEVLAPVLSLYFGAAIDLGVFPHKFKTAKVIPMFKAGDKQIPSNYRPISLLPNLSKILEKFITTQLLKFFEKHNVFYPSQYGFRKKCSVIHALLDVTTNAYDEIQYKKYTAIMLMDIRKAFDAVSHKILLCKLRHYGIRGPAFSLIENYLTSRSQFVFVNNCSSSSKPVSIGVPQGSILGPLLFLIYMNDLYNATLSRPRLFADDTCLMVSEKSISLLEQSCNSELHRLKNGVSPTNCRLILTNQF